MAKINQSVIKALDVLETLSESENGLKLSELAGKVEYPASTTHRLLFTLMEKGYVEQDKESSRYYLGVKILSLQAQSIFRYNIVQSAYPYLNRLREEFDVTVNLGVLSDKRVVYLETLAAESTLSVYVPMGTGMPLHCTAMGKVFLAFLPKDSQHRLLFSLELKQLTPNSITSLPDLRSALDEIKANNYAIDNEEFAMGVRCFSAPIRDRTGDTIAAVSLTGLVNHLPLERENEITESLLSVCHDISLALGFRKNKR